MQFTVHVAVEQDYEVEADDFNSAAELARQKALAKQKPVALDAWVTGVYTSDRP